MKLSKIFLLIGVAMTIIGILFIVTVLFFLGPEFSFRISYGATMRIYFLYFVLMLISYILSFVFHFFIKR
jgi:hypothetical protein